MLGGSRSAGGSPNDDAPRNAEVSMGPRQHGRSGLGCPDAAPCAGFERRKRGFMVAGTGVVGSRRGLDERRRFIALNVGSLSCFDPVVLFFIITKCGRSVSS